MERNTYAILGHSFHTNNNGTRVIPQNVHLYLPAKCGHVFSQNNEYRPILLNKNMTKKLLPMLERFDPGNKYPNQTITIGPKNSALYYGLYSLPNNIKNPAGSSLVNVSAQRKVKLSNLLNLVKGNVIGIFCRNMAHLGENVSFAKKRGKRTYTIGGDNYNGRIATLRPITAKRQMVIKAKKIIKNLMNTIPKGRKK